MSWGKKDKKEADSPMSPKETQIAPEEGDFELEGEEAGAGIQSDKLKKLRAELEKCKEEKQEYLVGWQRCKADSINARKEAMRIAERAGNRARDALIEDIIPALDSFDMAMAGDAWTKMDENWRMGMENVRSQLIGALLNQGVNSYAEIGDVFDPILHEAVQEVQEKGDAGSVAKVLRRGYRFSERIIRPAQVAIVAHPYENTE
ncbi:MAG TPA: nucleotide exchange factor GrpE [Candidatus Paceibacterota bacterium]|nr:nucleotide exchange factor GrpE [Candidatus Paceibacterota bacterium]